MADSHLLKGKRAVVTGAASGIGRASALALAQHGARVVAIDRDCAGLEGLSRESGLIVPLQLDVTDSSGLRHHLGAETFDIAFNCAGWVHQGTILECDDHAWRATFQINVDPIYHACRALIPNMQAAGGGCIINMSSVASSVKGATARFAYGASKAAVIGLTKSIAADFASYNIRCNAICPGTVHTPSLAQRVADLAKNVDGWEGFVKRQPLGRLGTADEIAALVLYLASDAAAFATGSIFVVDGGWSN